MVGFCCYRNRGVGNHIDYRKLPIFQSCTDEPGKKFEIGMKASPPKRALQFLRWFCREDGRAADSKSFQGQSLGVSAERVTGEELGYVKDYVVVLAGSILKGFR